MEVELRHVDLDGRRIPINGKFRQEGEGNTLAVVGAILLSALLLLVTGKSAVITSHAGAVAYISRYGDVSSCPYSIWRATGNWTHLK